MYLTNDGTEVTIDQIRAAFTAGDAMLVHGHTDGGTSTGLMLDGIDRDTRDECYSMWEEVWTSKARSVNQCCGIARC